MKSPRLPANWLERPLARDLLGGLFVLAPPYVFEKADQFFFLTHQHFLFFTLSGIRYDFDVVYLAAAGYIVGRSSKGLARSWAVYLMSVVVFLWLVYSACSPRLCYNTGVDGLEPLRMGSIFAAVGIASVFSGWALRQEEPRKGEVMLAGGAAFYAIAYHPVVFSLAGAGILPPLDPTAVYAFLAGLGWVVSKSLPEEFGVFGVLRRFAVSTAAILVLLAVSEGIAGHYITQELWFLASAALASAGGAFVGAAQSRVSAKWGKRFYAVLILFVLLVTLVVWPDAVAGQVLTSTDPLRPAAYSYVTPYYVGGFMSSPMVRPTAVTLDVSFAQGDASSIPGGGFLAAGIGVHAADCCTDGIDYGYRFDRVLYPNGSQFLTGSAWEVCDANAACGGHSWKQLLYHFSSPLGSFEASEPVHLIIGWELRRVAFIFGGSLNQSTTVVGSFLLPRSANAAFNAGWLGPPDKPSFRGAFFFQFGVASVGTPTGSWSVTLSCPAIPHNGSWTCVDHAQTLQGDQSFWKVLWRWGELFPKVDVAGDNATKTIIVSGSENTVGSFEPLW
ncbi:MAG: hypothetical protein HY247_05215 [archaeon]|nr:MAG: hypothetical protein HY247_05215 [archaeon]